MELANDKKLVQKVILTSLVSNTPNNRIGSRMYMRKYVLLFASFFLIVASIWSIYKINQPQVGPIGNDDRIPVIFWITINTNFATALFALIMSIRLFRKKK